MTTKEQNICHDLYGFVNEIDYQGELFDFINTRVKPNAKLVPKRSRLGTNPRTFFINRKKSSIIICPFSKCGQYCIETEGSPLIDQFVEHVKNVHDLKLKYEFFQKLSTTIDYIQNNTKIQYTDPFLHVDYESLLQNKCDKEAEKE